MKKARASDLLRTFSGPEDDEQRVGWVFVRNRGQDLLDAIEAYVPDGKYQRAAIACAQRAISLVNEAFLEKR